MTEQSFDKEQWFETFDGLPPAKQKGLQRWFATQALIIHNLGIEEERWFGLVWWALENPLDFSFLEAFPESGGDGDGRDAEPDAGESARAFLGVETKKQVATGGEGVKKGATGGGLDKELYQRFMANQMTDSAARAGRKKPTATPAAPPKPKRPARPNRRRGEFGSDKDPQ